MAANGSEKAFCVLTFHECRSVTIVQRQFRTKFGKQTPSDNSIRRWYAQFQETGCVCKRKSTGRPSVTEEEVQQVRQVHTSKFLLHTCKVSNKNLECCSVKQKSTYSYLKCIVYDKLLKPRQLFWITLYSSEFSVVAICFFSVFCISFVDNVYSQFLFHQRCARRNPHPIVDMAIRHMTD